MVMMFPDLNTFTEAMKMAKILKPNSRALCVPWNNNTRSLKLWEKNVSCATSYSLILLDCARACCIFLCTACPDRQTSALLCILCASNILKLLLSLGYFTMPD